MKQLREMLNLFVEIVDAEVSKQFLDDETDPDNTDEEYLDEEISRCLVQMARLKREILKIDSAAYTLDAYQEWVREILLAPSEDDPELRLAREVFANHCYFQLMVSKLKNFPELQKRFQEMGLKEWTKRRVDRMTFFPFAVQTVQYIEERFQYDASLPSETAEETAEMVQWIAIVYELTLSPLAQSIIDWYLDLPEMDDPGIGVMAN